MGSDEPGLLDALGICSLEPEANQEGRTWATEQCHPHLPSHTSVATEKEPGPPVSILQEGAV